MKRIAITPKTTKEAYADYLSSEGHSHFFTLTTEYNLTLKSARRLAERTFHNWNAVIPDIKGFWVAERFKDKYGYHIHGLLFLPKAFKSQEDFVLLLDGYQKATGYRKVDRWQRIDLRRIKRRSSDAHEYVAKYVSKSINVDYDWYVDNQMKLSL